MEFFKDMRRFAASLSSPLSLNKMLVLTPIVSSGYDLSSSAFWYAFAEHVEIAHFFAFADKLSP